MLLFNVACMSCSELFANTNLLKYAKNKEMINLLLGILGYIGVIYFLIKCFNHGNLTRVTLFWEAFIVIMSTLIGYFFLEETMSHPLEYLAIVLILVAIVCMHCGHS